MRGNELIERKSFFFRYKWRVSKVFFLCSIDFLSPHISKLPNFEFFFKKLSLSVNLANKFSVFRPYLASNQSYTWRSQNLPEKEYLKFRLLPAVSLCQTQKAGNLTPSPFFFFYRQQKPSPPLFFPKFSLRNKVENSENSLFCLLPALWYKSNFEEKSLFSKITHFFPLLGI